MIRPRLFALKLAPLRLTLLLTVLLAACSSNQVSRSAEGAIGGAAAGAVGSMFAAAIFGGDIGDAAARGAAWGAGAGAVSGAIRGSQEDARQRQQEQAAAERERQAALNELRREIGPDTFDGLAALTDGKHQVAIAYAQTAMTDSNQRYAIAGHWLEALTYQDLGDDKTVAEKLPELVQIDPEVSSHLEAAEILSDLTDGLAAIRAEFG